MARPRYSATKRAREINKQQERARKLARKHAKRSQRASAEAAGESVALDTQGNPLAGQASEAAAPSPTGAPADVISGPETNPEA